MQQACPTRGEGTLGIKKIAASLFSSHSLLLTENANDGPVMMHLTPLLPPQWH
jgi:hypothetical protein